MKSKLLFSIAVIAFTLASCTTIRTTPRMIDAHDSKIIIKPLLAEVEVDLNKKITGTATARNMSADDVKELAKWDAITKSGADIIVDPVFKISTTWRTTTVEVTGFFGKYTSIKTVEESDLENLDLYTTPSNSSGGGSVLSKLKKLKKKK